MSIAVLGSGAFGTALALSLATNSSVPLWARTPAPAREMPHQRCNRRRLGDFAFPETLTVTNDLKTALKDDILMLAVPLQQLRGFLTSCGDPLGGKTLVACCKGIEQGTGMCPHDIIGTVAPTATPAVLNGPGFARDIAAGLPTAMTLAAGDNDTATALQSALSTATLRLYRSTDMTGAALGGALKNVVAITCGAAMGAGLGESARAAVMTRGNAEMTRLAALRGADPATLSGLSGFGDLVLTCSSELSRNYRAGLALGREETLPENTTIEGVATARAVCDMGQDIDLPITRAVTARASGELRVADAMDMLLKRPLKEETC